MLPPSPKRDQQCVVRPENDGGKLGKADGKTGSDELLPGASLNTHEEAMRLLRILGKCWVHAIRHLFCGVFH